MIDRAYALRLAAYNRWMNQNLYACAARLTDEQRREDRGAFFKSLHGTFEHLVSTDTIWMDRFKLRQVGPMKPLALSFEALRSRRAALDEEIIEWAGALESDWLAGDFSYYSYAYAAHYSKPGWQLAAHLFNHQTHHRGQATTLLMQFGLDPGPTDLLVSPE